MVPIFPVANLHCRPLLSHRSRKSTRSQVEGPSSNQLEKPSFAHDQFISRCLQYHQIGSKITFWGIIESYSSISQQLNNYTMLQVAKLTKHDPMMIRTALEPSRDTRVFRQGQQRYQRFQRRNSPWTIRNSLSTI